MLATDERDLRMPERLGSPVLDDAGEKLDHKALSIWR